MTPPRKRPGDPPFVAMEGLPPRDDPQLEALADTAARLPRAAADALIRNLYRAALGYERTGDPDYLTCLAADALVTMRLRRDPEYEKALTEAPARPADPGDAGDVEDMLAQWGL